jgi:hypothetical protein
MSRKAFSFSLWGDAPKYTIGAVQNAKLIGKLFPNWEAWYYIHTPSVPKNIIDELASFPYVRIMNKTTLDKPSTWRFMAIDDPNVSVMSCRDCDSRVSLREKVAMEEWLSSKFPFHIMRDHPDHTHPVMTGMFDTRKLPNVNWENKIREYKSNEEYHHFYDMEFVRDVIYPVIKNNSLVHDSFYVIEPNTKRFSLPYDKTFFHIGGYIDEKEEPSVSHVNGLMSRYVSKYGIVNRPLQSREEWVDQMVCFMACSNLKEARYLEPLFSIIKSFPTEEMKREYSNMYSDVCLEYYLFERTRDSERMRDSERTRGTDRGNMNILRESLAWNPKNDTAYEIFSSLISQECLVCKTPQESVSMLQECIIYRTNDIVIHYDLGYFLKQCGNTYLAILRNPTKSIKIYII